LRRGAMRCGRPCGGGRQRQHLAVSRARRVRRAGGLHRTPVAAARRGGRPAGGPAAAFYPFFFLIQVRYPMKPTPAPTSLERLTSDRVVPVLRYADAATAGYAAEIAVQAGCRAIELTWTIPAVADLVRALRDEHGDTITLGVG